jgi:hypothetical protein
MFQETDDKVSTGEITEDSTENEFPIRSTETGSLDRNRFDRGHELYRTEILTEITGLMSESESRK